MAAAHYPNILIVDDTPQNLSVLHDMLTAQGYRVRPALNGDLALKAVRHMLPDLILLDIMMFPGIDGYEVCRRLKSDERYRHVPIIFISALGDVDDKIKAFEAGGVDYITKPFHVQEVLARVETHLALQAMQRQQQAHTIQVQQYAHELQAANAELAQYAYVVSHDLKAPLRAIHNYADFLSEDLGDRLEEEQQSYLDGMKIAVREANTLIDDILALSRLERRHSEIETLDVGEFLRALIDGLNLPNDVEISMPDDWPAIAVEPLLFRQIFQNLLGNAVKFTIAECKKIELGWRTETPGWYEFFVRDNGIGIAPDHQQQIFQIFERLHTKEEFDGTGIGLAIVKKAAGKLGGSIRVESEPGRGSTFFLMLPESTGIHPSPGSSPKEL